MVTISGSSSLDAETYNEVEVQFIGHNGQLSVSPQAANGYSELEISESDEFTFDATERGLDRGELAELLAMRTMISYEVREFDNDPAGTDNDINEPVQFRGFYELGTHDEPVRGSDIDIEDIPIDSAKFNSGSGTFRFGRESVDSAGMFDQGTLFMESAFKDFNATISGGAGGNSSGPHLQYWTNFRQELGTSGPIVDRLDELTSHFRLTAHQYGGKVGFNINRQLYWNVMNEDEVDGMGGAINRL